MQIDRTTSTTTTATRRRPSHINLSGATASAITDDILSPRTPKSISKSRRGSLVAECVQEAFETSSTSNNSRPSSILGNNSHAHGVDGSVTPGLLSETTTTYFDPPAPAAPETARQDTNLLPPTPAGSIHTNNRMSSMMAVNRPRASSISSIMTTHGVATPNFDVHTLYRIKTSRSSKKLDHFFGEFIPHDICIREIKKEGLKALLQSKVPLCYFLYHLLEEYSHENLFFFIELEQYETFQYVSRIQQLATAQHIFNTYLTRNSHFEVNLDDKVRRVVTEALQRKDVDTCFETAKRSVYSLLESSYMRFMMTDNYHQMITTCGELTTHYPDETRFAAVNVLLGYIEREHAMIYTNPLTDAPVFMSVSQTSKRRHELIKSMIHEFCRTLVGVEFNYYQQDPNEPPAPLSDPSQQQRQQQRSPPPPETKSPKQHGKGKFDFLKKK